MKIPATFQLHGITYTVRIDPTLKARENTIGEARYREDKVYLMPSESGFQSPTRMEQTFCHELVHIILHEMDHPLRDDEHFVDNFSALLHQYVVSSDSAFDIRKQPTALKRKT